MNFENSSLWKTAPIKAGREFYSFLSIVSSIRFYLSLSIQSLPTIAQATITLMVSMRQSVYRHT